MGGRGSDSYSAILGASTPKRALTDKQQKAVDAYIGDEHGEVGLVRAVQQGKDIGPEQEKYKQMGDVIESVIAQNKAEYGKIYRGISASKSEVKKYVEGYVFDQKGTSSWSGSDDMALRYATRRDISGLPIMFISHSGKKAAPIGRYSSLNEDEWLHSKKQKFKVLSSYDYYSRQHSQTIRIIDVEET